MQKVLVGKQGLVWCERAWDQRVPGCDPWEGKGALPFQAVGGIQSVAGAGSVPVPPRPRWSHTPAASPNGEPGLRGAAPARPLCARPAPLRLDATLRPRLQLRVRGIAHPAAAGAWKC